MRCLERIHDSPVFGKHAILRAVATYVLWPCGRKPTTNKRRKGKQAKGGNGDAKGAGGGGDSSAPGIAAPAYIAKRGYVGSVDVMLEECWKVLDYGMDGLLDI